MHLIIQRYIDIQKRFHFTHPPVFFKFQPKVFAFLHIFLQVLGFYCGAVQLSGGGCGLVRCAFRFWFWRMILSWYNRAWHLNPAVNFV